MEMFAVTLCTLKSFRLELLGHARLMVLLPVIKWRLPSIWHHPEESQHEPLLLNRCHVAPNDFKLSQIKDVFGGDCWPTG